MQAGLSRLDFAELPGWHRHDHAAALNTFRHSCREMLEQASGFRRQVRFGGSPTSWRSTCLAAFEAGDPRQFFETRFEAFRVHDSERPHGLFTGYYEPEVEGSRKPNGVFHVPLYARPPDLVAFEDAEQPSGPPTYGRLADGKQTSYFTRREIENGALSGQGLELVWLKDWADAFFIHIQGSGRIRLAEGGTMRLSYAAKSGLPYTAIGGILVSRGVASADKMSMQVIRQWIAKHPEEARHLMWENQSFVFFREVDLDDPGLGALGAQHVQLTPQRSLAVDRSLWMFGTPIWLETEAPSGEDGRMEPFRQLLVAQDTGSAIKGWARGDVYWGFGEAAARIAGPMKSAGSMVVLLPVQVARELGLPG